jgi:hypothetical protein
MKKSISTVEGVLSMLAAMKDAASGNWWWRDDSLTDELPNGIVVDTCMRCFDIDVAETGIMREGVYSWIIVEQYSTPEEAQTGHAKWVALMRENTYMLLNDIGVWE